jgi:hypothetical protein
MPQLSGNEPILGLNSPSPEGVVNNNVSSEIRSSTPLVESSLPINPLLNVIQDLILL